MSSSTIKLTEEEKKILNNDDILTFDLLSLFTKALFEPVEENTLLELIIQKRDVDEMLYNFAKQRYQIWLSLLGIFPNDTNPESRSSSSVCGFKLVGTYLGKIVFPVHSTYIAFKYLMNSNLKFYVDAYHLALLFGSNAIGEVYPTQTSFPNANISEYNFIHAFSSSTAPSKCVYKSTRAG